MVGARVEGFFAQSAVLRFTFSLAHGMSRDGVWVYASAMAFDLCLSLIPLLALAGWLLTVLLRESPQALQSVSTLLDSTHAQRLAIGAVLAGGSRLVDGGPGTGKTQAAVNVAAALSLAGIGPAPFR